MNNKGIINEEEVSDVEKGDHIPKTQRGTKEAEKLYILPHHHFSTHSLD
jgi:hypothetical protein